MIVPLEEYTMLLLEDDGQLLLSEEGIVTALETNTTEDFLGGTFDGRLMIVVGTNGTILTSEDGELWTPRVSGTTENLWDVTSTGENYFIVGDNSTALRSADGVTWTPFATPHVRRDYVSIEAAKDRLFLVEESGELMISEDEGETWPEPRHIGFQDPWDLVWTGHALVAVADDGLIMMSREGFNSEYVSWLEAKGVKPFQSAPEQDSNRDGVTNLMAYALNLQHEANLPPEERARAPQPHLNEAGTRLSLEFEKPVDRAAVSYFVEAFSVGTGAGWTVIAEKHPNTPWMGEAEVDERPTVDGRVRVEVAQPDPISESGGQIIRLRVDWQEAPYRGYALRRAHPRRLFSRLFNGAMVPNDNWRSLVFWMGGFTFRASARRVCAPRPRGASLRLEGLSDPSLSCLVSGSFWEVRR